MYSAIFLTHFLEFFFAPPGVAWYQGNVWGNVVAIIPCGILAVLWARTKLKVVHTKLDLLVESHKAIHKKLDGLAAR